MHASGSIPIVMVLRFAAIRAAGTPLKSRGKETGQYKYNSFTPKHEGAMINCQKRKPQKMMGFLTGPQ